MCIMGRPERGTSREAAGGGLTSTGADTKELERELNDAERDKLLLCMGNPSGPAGHLPYEAEEFC